MQTVAEILHQNNQPWVWAPGIDETFSSPPNHTLSGLELPELVALASLCGAWIGNDTGTTHLARATGAHTIALFGPTHPGTWCPKGALPFSFKTDPELIASRAINLRKRRLKLHHSH